MQSTTRRALRNGSSHAGFFLMLSGISIGLDPKRRCSGIRTPLRRRCVRRMAAHVLATASTSSTNCWLAPGADACIRRCMPVSSTFPLVSRPTTPRDTGLDLDLQLTAGADEARYRVCTRPPLFCKMCRQLALIVTTAGAAVTKPFVRADCRLTQLVCQNDELLNVFCQRLHHLYRRVHLGTPSTRTRESKWGGGVQGGSFQAACWICSHLMCNLSSSASVQATSGDQLSGVTETRSGHHAHGRHHLAQHIHVVSDLANHILLGRAPGTVCAAFPPHRQEAVRAGVARPDPPSHPGRQRPRRLTGR